MLLLLSITLVSDCLPVFVEECRGERDSLHDKLQVFDALALLLKGHAAAVVNVDDNVVESEADNIHRDLTRDPPRGDQLVYALRGALGSLLDARVAGRVEALKVLLLDGLFELPDILTNVLRGRRRRWATSELTLLLLRWSAVLLTTRGSLRRVLLLLLAWWRRAARVGLGSSLLSFLSAFYSIRIRASVAVHVMTNIAAVALRRVSRTRVVWRRAVWRRAVGRGTVRSLLSI